MTGMEKLSTGIDGFDQVARGGLPRSRITLIAGSAGSGKTLFMLTAAARGAAEQGVPAVFLSFEERTADIIDNAAAIGLDLPPLIDSGMLRIEQINRPTEMVEEAGGYTLDGLLIRLELALSRTKARIIAIDTIETLFGMFEDQRTVRQELVRVFNWLKERGVTAIVSGEQGDGQLTRHGLEEYVSDCVVLLVQRMVGDVATRRLRVVKYRGAEHDTNEFPFLIDGEGITVMPLSSARLNHTATAELVTTGLEGLDAALHGGIRRGSSVLITGSSGTGKTLMAASAIAAACQRGETAAVLNFEESPDELLLNTGSVGIDLKSQVSSGRLVIQAARPTLLGLEQHLVEIYRLIERIKPTILVVDSLSSLKAAGSPSEVYRTMVRLIDQLKRRQITSVLTAELPESGPEFSGMGISSIIDVWLLLEWDRSRTPFTRRMSVRKKRGSGHAKDYIPFDIGPNGIEIEIESSADA